MSQLKRPAKLTKEKIEMFMKRSESLKDDDIQLFCTHHLKNGESSLVKNQDGTFTCSICNANFESTDLASISEFLDTINELLDSVKVMYLDLPCDHREEFYSAFHLIRDGWE